MTVGPAERSLQDEVQAIEFDAERNLNAAQDFWFHVVERDFETGDRRSCRQLTTFLRLRPAPGQQSGKVCDLVVVDARQHVGEPGLRVDR